MGRNKQFHLHLFLKNFNSIVFHNICATDFVWKVLITNTQRLVQKKNFSFRFNLNLILHLHNSVSLRKTGWTSHEKKRFRVTDSIQKYDILTHQPFLVYVLYFLPKFASKLEITAGFTQ